MIRALAYTALAALVLVLADRWRQKQGAKRLREFNARGRT